MALTRVFDLFVPKVTGIPLCLAIYKKTPAMDISLATKTKGDIGEDIACKFLEKNSFLVVDRNYFKKWGELDIVAEKDNVIHFFEVKSVTDNFSKLFEDSHKPEENVDGWKVKHLRRIIETYLDEKRGGLDIEFKFHVICVYMNNVTRRARIKWLSDVII